MRFIKRRRLGVMLAAIVGLATLILGFEYAGQNGTSESKAAAESAPQRTTLKPPIPEASRGFQSG